MTSDPRIPTYTHITATRCCKPDWYTLQAGPKSSSDLSSSPLTIGLNVNGQRSMSGPLRYTSSSFPNSMLAQTKPQGPKTSNYNEACKERERRDSGIMTSSGFLIAADRSCEDSNDEIEEAIVDSAVDAPLKYSTGTLQGNAPSFRPVVCRSPSEWRREWYRKHLSTSEDGQDHHGYSSTSVSPRPRSPSLGMESERREGNISISRGRDRCKHARDRASTP